MMAHTIIQETSRKHKIKSQTKNKLLTIIIYLKCRPIVSWPSYIILGQVIDPNEV